MSQRGLLVIVLTVVLVMALLIVEYAFDQRRVLTWFVDANSQQLALGQEVYQTSCAACHGANLEGEPNWQSGGPDGLMPAPPHDETGHTWHHTDALLFDIVKYGVANASNLEGYASAMPAYDGILTDQEIVAVLAFIKSQWPNELQDSHDQLNQRAQR